MRGNPENRPKEGDKIRVEPIRDEADIQSIKKLLTNSPRDLLLFTMGINNGLRAGDLLKLHVWQVKDAKPGDLITIIEGKTGKPNVLAINKMVYKALQNYLDSAKPDPNDYLFSSQKRNKGNQPITIQRVNQMIKQWTSDINLKGNFGAHSLRKTFGFAHRTRFGTGFEILAKRFNHSSPSITMRYLGLSPEEVNGILKAEI